MRRPPAIDVAFAVALLLAGTAGALTSESTLPRAAVVALTVLYAVPLAFRRQAPHGVPLVVMGAILIFGLADPLAHQPLIPFAIGVAAFTAGFHGRDPWSGIVAGVAFVAFEIAVVAEGQGAADALFFIVLLGGPWAAGAALRHAEQRRTEGEREAVAAERIRLARELHDVVTHSISVVTLQTQAVRLRLRADQESEAADLRAVEETARDAMAEMRRLLGVLRAAGEPAPLAPQPGLHQLPRLVEATRAAGVAVSLEMTGSARPLPPGVDLTAYRIVQEALTNVARHAGAGARAAVAVTHGDGAVRVTISDDGRGAASAPDGAGGHGLAGMRERVALYGGRLEAGPTDGGFRVEAVLPA